MAGKQPSFRVDAEKIEALDKVAAALAEFPKSGRPGRVPGTRELVISKAPYIVACRIAADGIEVLAVLHGAREWPESL